MNLSRLNLGFKKNKKANAIIDTLFIIIILGVFVTIAIVGNQINDEITGVLNQTDDLSQESKEVLNNLDQKYPSIFDGLFVFGFVILWIAALAASYLVDAQPAFFIISVIILVFVFFILMLLSNSWGELFDDPDLNIYAEEFPKSMFIIDNLLIFGVVVAFSIIIVLFGKNAVQ